MVKATHHLARQRAVRGLIQIGLTMASLPMSGVLFQGVLFSSLAWRNESDLFAPVKLLGYVLVLILWGLILAVGTRRLLAPFQTYSSPGERMQTVWKRDRLGAYAPAALSFAAIVLVTYSFIRFNL